MEEAAPVVVAVAVAVAGPPMTRNDERTTPPAVWTQEDEEEAQARAAQEEDYVGPPPFLPISTFAPKGLQILARRQTHIPILVIGTENANRLAWKNQLQLTDLFQGLVHELKLGGSNQKMPPFRSISKSIVPNPSLLVQFVEPTTQLQPHSYQGAHDLLQQHAKLQDADGNVVQELVLLEDRVDELLQDRQSEEELEQVTKDAYQLTSPLDIPWLVRYRLALDASTDALPHDLIHCPPLVLLVCTTNEVEAPEEVLQELRNSPHVLPDAFKNGLYDPSAMRHEVLVLHDAVDGPPDVQDALLRQNLQSQFGSQTAAVLRINSVLPGTAKALAAQEDTDLWGGKGQKGNCLSVNDRVLLRRYFQTLLTTSLLPALERRIADLNAIVSERKKGVRNLVKSFWRKPKEETPPPSSHKKSSHNSNSTSTSTNSSTLERSSAAAKYRFDSIESQTRLLADTLFLMQDYEAALSTYRLIRDDYKSDKALIHYANVQEMMALCLYHTDPYSRSKEIFSHLETALLSYTRAAEEERSSWGNDPSVRPSAAPHATRLATRLCLLLATASDSLTQGRELEVADLLASASSHESSLGAAVLLEQSSAFYYHAGMYRKYAFHMLMSGHMFRTSGQDHHAFRCFTSGLYIYRHGQWNELHNHLRSALASQLYTMGRMSVALILYAKLVAGGGKVSAKSQHKFLQHLLEICEQHPKPALAGADRMASPSNIPSNEREAFRNAQLERIVQVIRYTKGASRVLQLPYMNLPQIMDQTVRIWTHAEQHFMKNSDNDDDDDNNNADQGYDTLEVEQSMSAHFGKVSKGLDETWEDLQSMATAELNAVDSSKPKLNESVTAALARIADPHHRRVIAQLDKEKQTRNLIERSRRNGSAKATPPVRARGEPLFCDFVVQNPLSVEIQVSQIQLVARMVDKKERLCTSQDAIRIKVPGEGEEKTWTFASTDHLAFTVPEFCRISEPEQKACKSANDNPFFVVTKRDLALPAGEETVISAGLTPLVEGDLELLGVRCKLFDKVWVYHPFDIPGPLLNNNRTNRANRVRGESLVLKSKIEVNMPCLTAELVKRVPNQSSTVSMDEGPLLEGQISSWTIRLRNVGNAPASQATLKTNLPWVNIVSSDNNNYNRSSSTSEQLEAQTTSNCLGPTGTLIALPMEAEHLKEKGTIHPGESVDIPIQMRTSGKGTQEFYMLYRYELWDPIMAESSSSSSSRHRWLRKMYEVPVSPILFIIFNQLDVVTSRSYQTACFLFALSLLACVCDLCQVYPSLSLTARVLTSFWKDNEQLLSVEVCTLLRSDDRVL
jgi:hypothetical protein